MRTIKLAGTLAFAVAVLLFAAAGVSADSNDGDKTAKEDSTAKQDSTANKEASKKETGDDRSPESRSRDGRPEARHRGPRPGFGGYGRSGEHRRGPNGIPSGRPSMDRDGRSDRDGKSGPSHRGYYGKGRPSGTPRWPHHNWESMKKAAPEMYKLFVKDHALERRTRELALQYRQAPEEQRESIRKELVEAVDQHFEVRQQRRSLELKRLEEELQRLRQAIERRNKARKEISERRISELLGEDGLNF